jgi:hypothetical protein
VTSTDQRSGLQGRVVYVALRHPQSMKMGAPSSTFLLLKAKNLAPIFAAGNKESVSSDE